MATSGRTSGLQTIFSFFLGLMLTAFVGVGVYTFYPPDKVIDGRIQDINRQEQLVRDSRPAEALTPEDRDQIRVLNDQRNNLTDAAKKQLEEWGRSTSIILIVLATLVMAVSLVRAEQLPVISNGLLIGGVFTMLYGVGWVVATDTSISRFVVMTVALVVTLVLGYARFVRRRAASVGPLEPGMAPGQGMNGLEQRVQELEKRLDRAAGALGSDGGR